MQYLWQTPEGQKKMFISPPRTFFSLLPLAPILLLIGALIPTPSQGADPLPSSSKLEMSIPPGMDDLETLQADYEKSSTELQAHFKFIHENASACPNGAVIAKLFEKSAPAQAHQRKKIVDALNNSKFELQTEVAKLDGILAEMKQTSAGSTAVEASKSLINAGAAKPLAVIVEEQAKIKTHNKRMQDSVAGAASALDGPAAKCVETQKTYFEKMKPLALKIPDKLKLVEASLEAHTRALRAWADSVSGRPARVPASAQNSY